MLFLGLILVLSCVFRKKIWSSSSKDIKKTESKRSLAFFLSQNALFLFSEYNLHQITTKKKEEKDKSSHTKEPQIQKCKQILNQMTRKKDFIQD